MPITPADIEQLTFSPSKHGYDTDEVDNFLEHLSDEVGAMLQKIADLKGRLNMAEQQLAESQARVAQLEAGQPDPFAQQQVQQQASEMQASERQISQVLIVAQQSADRIVAEARENAEVIRTEADKKAREVIRQALAEKQAELDEIDRLKQSREDFRTDYLNLLQRYMDDAEAVFPDGVLAAAPAEQRVAVPATEATYAAPAPEPAEAPVIEMDDLD